MPALATMGRRSFSYHRLKKLPAAAPSPPATTTALALDQGEDPPCAAAAIEESYRSYYRALVARGRRQRQRWRGSGRPRPRRRLRVWGALSRALRRKAAAAGARVRASVARVARRLREGRPYVGDLFAGNYMFLQVAPSPTMVGPDGGARGAVVPFAEYYYGCKARASAAAGACSLRQPLLECSTRCSVAATAAPFFTHYKLRFSVLRLHASCQNNDGIMCLCCA